MTNIEDVAKSNEEVEKMFKDWYEKNIVQTLVDWMIKEVGVSWLKTKTESTFFYSMLCFILLNRENREYILEYDDYVEIGRKLNHEFPNGFFIHGYVKEDGKFHIYLEERTGKDVNIYYNSLFGKDVKISDE